MGIPLIGTDSTLIDMFSVPVSSSGHKDPAVISGQHGIANITLGYTLSCIDSSNCPLPGSTSTVEGRHTEFVCISKHACVYMLHTLSLIIFVN